MTATIEEIDLIQLFDFAIACGWSKKDPCPNEAKFFVTTRCCHAEVMLCQEHLDILREQCSDKILAKDRFGCAHCHTDGFASLEEWVIITPL